MPKQLNNGRISQALQRTFGFKGRYAPTLDEVIVPVYQIADPLPAEPQLTFGSRQFSPVPTGATAFAQIKIANPVGSGVFVMITSISVGVFSDAPGQADIVGITAIIADDVPLPNPSVFNNINRDTRNTGRGKATFTFGETTAVASTLSALATILALTDTTTAQVVGGDSAGAFRQPPIVLRPGRGLTLLTSGAQAIGTGGVPLLANYAWLEVPTGSTPTPTL